MSFLNVLEVFCLRTGIVIVSTVKLFQLLLSYSNNSIQYLSVLANYNVVTSIAI